MPHAFDAYIIPADQWSPLAENAMASRIADELVELTGCETKVAALAGRSFVAFRNAPGFGLSAVADRAAAVRARMALDAWIEAKEAAASHREAA